MAENAAHSHFESVASIEEAAVLLTFTPRRPRRTAGFTCSAIHVFVRDHRLRKVPREQRVVELHYGGFTVSQSHPGPGEARRLALELRYGPTPIDTQLLGHPCRIYELGPEVEPGDIDGRSPAAVTWCDDGMHYLVASDILPSSELVEVAGSLYE